MKRTIILVTVLLACGVVPASATAADVGRAVPGTYTTTWVGNSIVNGTTHVPFGMSGIVVTPNGRVLTNIDWDEAGGEVTEFDAAGNIIATAGHTHGWGYNGGSCIAANKQYVYVAQQVGSENGGLVDAQTWPVKEKMWYGISRRLLSDIRKGAPFDGGKGHAGDTLSSAFLLVGEAKLPTGNAPPVLPTPRVTAIAASETRLFVADPYQSRIRVYDANTMAPIADYPNLGRVTAMAIDAGGTLWVAQSADGNDSATVSAFTQSLQRTMLNINLAVGVRPVAIALDPAGKVVLADGGRASQILTFDPHHLTDNPTTPAGTFGTNLFAGTGSTVGRIAPGKFSDLTALGIDQSGNLFIASSVTGAVLERYDPHGQRAWARYALTFVDNASIDPLTGDLYSSTAHYGFDWSKTAPGSEWSYLGKTLDRFRYPDDIRTVRDTEPLMRRLGRGLGEAGGGGGRLYAFACNQMPSGICIYRFNSQSTGEIAIPCGCVVSGGLDPRSKFPNGQFIWRDINGDGQVDSGEIEQPSGDARVLGDDCWGWWVDERGDIWQAVNGVGIRRGIRRFPLKGFDDHDSPIYGFDTMTLDPVPAPFLHGGTDGLERILYDSNADVMYLGGFTADAQNDGLWGVFRVVARYDHWLAGNRKPSWVVHLPWTTPRPGHSLEVPICMAVAGDYLFAVGVQTSSRVGVYRTADGAYVGDMIPNCPSFTVDQTGWVDIRPFGIQANLRPDGSYAVCVEDDAYAKTILYRWRP